MQFHLSATFSDHTWHPIFAYINNIMHTHAVVHVFTFIQMKGTVIHSFTVSSSDNNEYEAPIVTCSAVGISTALCKHRRFAQNMTATACDHIVVDRYK